MKQRSEAGFTAARQLRVGQRHVFDIRAELDVKGRSALAALTLGLMLLARSSFSQGRPERAEHGFMSRLRHRVCLGEYTSYFPDDIRMLGLEYPVGDADCFTSLRLFHSSNGKAYA